MRILLEDLALQFKGTPRPLLEVSRWELASGGAAVLRGQSGTGKSTLLHTVSGLLLPARGTVTLGDTPINQHKERARSWMRATQIGVVFQRLNVLDDLLAEENLLLGPGPAPPRERVQDALDALEISTLRRRPTWQLSLGEQQRLAVARVLARKPPLVLADEPTSSLDDTNAERVLSALLRLQKEGSTLFVATHDARVTEAFRERWWLREGRLEAEST